MSGSHVAVVRREVFESICVALLEIQGTVELVVTWPNVVLDAAGVVALHQSATLVFRHFRRCRYRSWTFQPYVTMAGCLL